MHNTPNLTRKTKQNIATQRSLPDHPTRITRASSPRYTSRLAKHAPRVKHAVHTNRSARRLQATPATPTGADRSSPRLLRLYTVRSERMRMPSPTWQWVVCMRAHSLLCRCPRVYLCETRGRGGEQGGAVCRCVCLRYCAASWGTLWRELRMGISGVLRCMFRR